MTRMGPAGSVRHRRRSLNCENPELGSQARRKDSAAQPRLTRPGRLAGRRPRVATLAPSAPGRSVVIDRPHGSSPAAGLTGVSSRQVMARVVRPAAAARRVSQR